MREDPASISVVVPSFNQGRFIRETLDSLLVQNYPRLEVIVIDGGSSDSTVEVLKTYGTKITWISEKDDGQAHAIQKGFERASGQWLTWLNSDDVQCNEALWVVNETISADQKAEVVVGNGHYMDENGQNSRPYPRIECGTDVDVRDEIFLKGYMAQPSVFFRRDAYERVGRINTKLQYCMDYELWVRFALAQCRFIQCETDISGSRWYSSTKSSGQTLQLLSEVIATQVSHFGRVSPFFTQSVSDYLYHHLNSVHLGDKHSLLLRTIYFKSVWTWFNLRRPAYWARGLLTHRLAKSGPVINDRASIGDYVTAVKDVVIEKWSK